MRRFTVLMLAAASACLLTGGVLAGAASADVPYARWGGYHVLSDADKQTKMLDVLDRFVTQAESTWTDSSPVRQASGYFLADGPGVLTIRGNAEIAYIYATLLTARPGIGETFGVNDEVDHTTLKTHLEQALLAIAYTHRSNGGSTWGSVRTFNWQWTFWAAQAAFAAELSSSLINGATVTAVETALETEADAVAARDPDTWDRANGNSGGEETSSYSMAVATAAMLMRGDPSASTWATTAKEMSFNAVGRAADESDRTVVDGDTVANWVTTANLFDDFSMENHRIMHSVYLQGVASNLAENQLYHEWTGGTVPGAFSFRRQEIWDNVLGSLLADDGDLVQPSGNDWAKHDYQHFGYLAQMATLLSGDDAEVASVLESRALIEIEKRQIAHGGGSLIGLTRLGEIGYEVDVARQLALGWLAHEEFPDAPEPTEAEFEAAYATLDDVRSFPGNEVVTMKGPNAVASMSWQDDSPTDPMALIVPSARDHLDDPISAQYWFNSGPGAGNGPVSTHSCDCSSDDYFSSAAVIDDSPDRWFSMTSWADDGTTLLLDRGEGATFTFAFEHHVGIAGRRPVYTESGTKSNESFTGDWLNVDDRFGLVAKGGSGLRTDEYASDGSADFESPHLRVEGSASTGSRNRAAVVLPTATAAETRALAADMDQGATGDANWSAASARGLDGRARIAVARWGGSGTTTVSGLTSSLGAPIPDRNADITVNASSEASMSVTLGSPASVGWRGFFFVQTDQSVTVRPQSATRIKFTTSTSTGLSVTYVDDAGREHFVSKTVGTGVAYAEVIGGKLTLTSATASTEESGFPVSRAIDLDAATYWVSRSVDLSRSPQDLTLQFGSADVDVRKVVMNPRSNLGPRDYEIFTSPDCGAGSYTSRLRVTGASATSTTTSTLSSPVKAACVRIRITSQHGGGPPGQVQVEELSVLPADFDIDVLEPEVNLARNGSNSVKVRLRSNDGFQHSITLGTSLSGATGVSASVSPSSSLTVPATGHLDAYVELSTTGSTPTSGTGTLTLSASGAISETATLEFTSNLALNGNGTRFPAAMASSQDGGSGVYGPHLANDGDTSGGSNFWVSDPVSSLSTRPQCLFIDLGRAMNVGRVTMTPRTNYGPRDYVVQTYSGLGPTRDCANESSWTTKATVTGLANGVARDSSWAAVSTRWVRIKITAQHGSGPPFQVQVRELALAPS